MIIEDFKLRRTIRKYKNDQIPEKMLNELLEVAFRASTTGNMQLYSVIVTRDEENKKKLAPAHFNQPTVTTAPVVLTFCADFNRFISQPFEGRKFIAHCYEGEKPLLKDVVRKGEDALVLIGPEGDFSEEEVKQAIENGFEPISLGRSRLRTETAALVACHILNLQNQ